MTAIRLNPSAIDAYSRSASVKLLLARLGEAVVSDAQAAAPKRTGEGAASISYDVGEDADGAYVRVSWDDDHWYMRFPALGTSKQSPNPFLQNALLKQRSLK